MLGRPHTLLYAFASLRLLTDIVLQFSEYNPDEPPGWVVRLFGAGIGPSWRRDSARERSVAAENEISLPK